jgi:FtsP/CotA-like multicopper oxidase with cupredoxin domain
MPHGSQMPRGMGMHGGMMGMTHANDVRYDAYLANDRTLDDPQVVQVEKGGKARLRIINGGTATAFFISTPGLRSTCVAVDGSRCAPLGADAYPLAQGQRIDLLVEIPASGGAFAVLAQVEAARFRTGIVLATADAAVSRLAGLAPQQQGIVDLSWESRLTAAVPLTARRPDQSFTVMLGEEPGYRWTINGRAHGDHRPLEVRQGQRIEMTFMNPTMMMHPMHLHGHHFQVVGIGGRRWSGPMRDTVIVPGHMPVTAAFDAHHKGSWFLHCHHLYHMATGMMTEVRVT